MWPAKMGHVAEARQQKDRLEPLSADFTDDADWETGCSCFPDQDFTG
jgi:hypothetical protein